MLLTADTLRDRSVSPACGRRWDGAAWKERVTEWAGSLVTRRDRIFGATVLKSVQETNGAAGPVRIITQQSGVERGLFRRQA